jgi:hypothetical protein
MSRTLPLVALLLALSPPVLAEEDGHELLTFMQKPSLHEAAAMYIEAVRTEWNGSLFCVSGDDPKAAAFDAVKTYLETHPDQLYRPRRYLIIQGLRSGFPCNS